MSTTNQLHCELGRDENGNDRGCLYGDSVEDLARQVAEHGGADTCVCDEPGFTRGYIHRDGTWSAA